MGMVYPFFTKLIFHDKRAFRFERLEKAFEKCTSILSVSLLSIVM